MSRVYFIGAGPGDPELITLKGKRIIDCADLIIYAGSLVNEEVIASRKSDAIVYNSAGMTLDEIVSKMEEAARKGLTIARVHTGDPSIYGAMREQASMLEALGIEYEVIPGVSSFTAAASVLKKEVTLPGVSQTIICTRIEGRTAVPESEGLELLASHRASMSIFLSVHMIQDVVDKLLVHYPEDTPVSVVQKATWPEQKIIRGRLKDISEKIKNDNITKTALILVGAFLGDQFDRSKLYDKDFSHRYRKSQCGTD